MTNPFHSLITYEEDNWQSFIDKIGLMDVFKELIEKYDSDPSLLKSYIKYILWTYSIQSEKIIIGSDWADNKKKIFEACDFKPEEQFFKNTVYLECDVVLRTIHRWLKYQDMPVFTQYKVLKDLLFEMQVSANSPIKKSSGEIDFSQKFLNAGYVKELRKMISDCESELIQSSTKLKEGYKEVIQTMKQKNTKSTEEIFAN